ncbi:MAG: hypothetical protein ACRDKH_02320 [Solirubrobacterales bacterium]
MAPMRSDEPAGVSREESRQEYLGSGPSRTGMAASEIVLLTIAIVGAAIAFEEIDHWSQWVVLAAIIATVIGFMIAVSPSRRGA